MIDADVIRGKGIFSGVADARIERFAGIGDTRSVPADEYLFRLGEEAASLFVLESGEVDLTIPIQVLGVAKEIACESVKPGDTLAWSALVKPHVLTMSARARSDSRFVAFRAAAINAILAEYPDLGAIIWCNLAAVVAHRLHRIQTMWLREIQRGVKEHHG